MNTLPHPNFSISAQFLGPVLSLNGELTKNAQNLIFARNGTGKSFLSRAFRYLDLHGQKEPLIEAARNLVSDESSDGKGNFVFSRGTNALGALQLNKTGDIAIAEVTDTIFHVFSEDFVHEELREQQYNLNGKITNQIAVDSVSIKLSDARSALEKAQESERAQREELARKFDSEKEAELVKKAAVSKQLNEYKLLSFDGLEKYSEKPNLPVPVFAEILKDLDSLKAIPSEPVYPQDVGVLQTADTNLEALAALLARITAPSSVASDIKKKIDAHHSFYEIGIAIIEDEHRQTCPFCEQGITTPSPKTVIDAYVRYFADEEEKHKSELRKVLVALDLIQSSLTAIETAFMRQKARYDDLKSYIPSRKGFNLANLEEAIKRVRSSIEMVRGAAKQKMAALSVAASLPEQNFAALAADLNGVIQKNNALALDLTSAVQKADRERKDLQRKVCTAFEREFVIRNWSQIENLRKVRSVVKERGGELSALERSAPSTDARSRVADTFDLLLREFFADKYQFDKKTFVLKRGSYDMARGSHRTLSDGEKTAIAFCYFVACVHRKVLANGDYEKLFLVFDDPVTSMSYDFVFAIAQTLKNLTISDKGEVSVKSNLVGANCARPNLLVLTHSTYFFNVARTNRVVKEESTFALHPEKGAHKIVPLKRYAAPFNEQLRNVYEIASGKCDPDHWTGNAIRCVLEAIGRFCRPDKSESLSEFVQYIASEDGIAIKSVLINSLSHGTYYDETPSPDDLKLACTEALLVVEKYAAGQLEILKAK